MALPDFKGQTGLALIRINLETGERFFVKWVSGFADFTIERPGPGVWQWNIVIISGSGSAGQGGGSITGAGVTNGSSVSILAIQAKK